MHPQFATILRHAVKVGIGIEVYTNLVHITDEVWDLLRAPSASLAFSYYSNQAAPHNAVTLRNSHAATRRNAAKACVFSRWMQVGNVLSNSLAEIVTGKAMADAVASIPNGRRSKCDPDLCDPDIMCSPGSPPSSCKPRT